VGAESHYDGPTVAAGMPYSLLGLTEHSLGLHVGRWWDSADIHAIAFDVDSVLPH
jgi:hypothetical protein